MAFRSMKQDGLPYGHPLPVSYGNSYDHAQPPPGYLNARLPIARVPSFFQAHVPLARTSGQMPMVGQVHKLTV